MIDIVVIGAGPAGCAAAIWAAARGLKVILVERQQFPRFRPGECLHPGVEVLFRDLGILGDVLQQTLVRPLARTVVFEGRRSVQSFGADTNGPWQALHVSRAELDAILLTRAQQLGVMLHIDRSRVTPISSNGKIEGVELNGRTFRCAFVIDASGQGAWLTRALRREHLTVSPRLTAFYGYCRGHLQEEQLFEATAAGWQWVAQITPNIVNWTSLHFGVHKIARLPVVVPSLSPFGRSCGSDVTWRIAPSVAGPSHFIVGDAAFVTDPASGNGVLRAIMSGIKAVHNAEAVLVGRATPISAAQDYSAWMTRWFDADTAQLARLYDTLLKDWRATNDAAIARPTAFKLQSIRNPLISFPC